MPPYAAREESFRSTIIDRFHEAHSIFGFEGISNVVLRYINRIEVPESPIAAGKTYPFLFTAIEPDTRRWPYRLIPSTNPEHLTEAQLAELFQRREVLHADWEEQEGHPLGLITIYLPPEDGASGARQARFDLGPELTLELRPLRKLPEPNVAPQPPKTKIEPKTPDFGGFSF